MQTYFAAPPAGPGEARASQARHHCDEASAHVGVVFVHGVGFQEASDTFVEAIGPLIRLIREGGYPEFEPLPDPVVRGGLVPGTTMPFAEVAVPTVELDSAQHWILTEAWWASSFRPPSVATMLGWLGGEGGIARAARRLGWRPPSSKHPRPSRTLAPDFLSESIVLASIATLMLVIYAGLRSVFAILPISSLRELTIGRVDRFMTGWAGDMRVMTSDEAQAGMIRARIVEAIEAVQRMGCDRVVVVAHSGGVVASYMTLADPANATLPVVKLISFGQGLSIAWRLMDVSAETSAERALNLGGYLALPLPATIEWTDFFATDDPVPAGPIWTQYRADRENPPPDACWPLSGQAREWSGTRVANRWQMPDDHGEYFANDEQFLIPVARSIYDAGRSEGRVSLFRATDSKHKASVRREQRVRVLDIWRKLALAAGVLALFGSVTTSFVAHWLTGQSIGLYQPAQPVIEAGIGFWDGLGFLTERLPGATPPLWQATLIGYLLWPVVIGAFVWTLVPRIGDWRTAWPKDDRHAHVGIGIVSVVLWAIMGIALIFGIPGLVGVGLSTSPVSEQLWFREVFLDDGYGGGLYASLADRLGQAVAAPVWGVIMTVLGLVIVAMAVGVIYLTHKLLRSRTWRTRWRPAAIAIHTAFSGLLFVGALLCMLWALIADVGFRINAVGWLLILVVALLLQRIGVWRWNSWDRQERVVARSRWREGTRGRPLGRPFDISIFVLLGVSLMTGAASIALRPADPGWSMLAVAAIGGIAISVALGAAQDAINERALAAPSIERQS
jgi:hypothetical protein